MIKGAVKNSGAIGFWIDFVAKCQWSCLQCDRWVHEKIAKQNHKSHFLLQAGAQNNNNCDKSQNLVTRRECRCWSGWHHLAAKSICKPIAFIQCWLHDSYFTFRSTSNSEISFSVTTFIQGSSTLHGNHLVTFEWPNIFLHLFCASPRGLLP